MGFLSLAVAVAVLLTGGVVSAVPNSSKPLNAAGPHVPKGGGHVELTGYSNNDGPRSTVLLTGAVGDFGEAVRSYASGTTDSEYNRLVLSLSRGSFQLGIASLESKLNAAFSGNFPSDTATCSGIVTITGSAPIVEGSGTRAYRGLSGTFTLTITINEVDSWPTCPKTDTAPFLAQTVFLTGAGTVSLH
jgi:hypothetical protein